MEPLADLISRIWLQGRFSKKGKTMTPTTTEQTVTCCQCGMVGKLYYTKDIKDDLITKQWCFNCWFWEEKVMWEANKVIHDPIRINGNHYLAGSVDCPDSLRGFGGQSFQIQFDDGRTIKTSNLWHQGKIPAHFRDRLPDNARFV